MSEYTVELARLKTDRSLVLWVKESGNKEFVVCTDYDPNKPVGSQWIWGHYFWDVFSAVDYISLKGYAKEDSDGI